MSTEVGSIYVKVDANTRDFERGMGRVRGGLGAATKAAGLFAAAVGVGLVYGLKKSIESANDHAVALALTEAHLKSTKAVSGQTTKSILAFSDAMEKSTGIDDLAVQAGENMLLTFTKIRENFKEASKATIDLATSLNDGLAPSQEKVSKTAILVGKALQDPIRGLTAMRRVGIAFTDAQEKQIKAMVKAGDVAGAQKVILKELATETGGAAAAFGKTFPGQVEILKQRLDDLAQKVGEKLIPALSRAVAWLNTNWPQISRVATQVANGFMTAVDAIRPVVVALVAGIAWAVAIIEQNWPRIRAAAESVVNWYQTNLAPTITAVVQYLTTLWNKFGADIIRVTQAAFTLIATVVVVSMRILKDAIEIALALIRGDWGKAWNSLKDLLKTALGGALAILRAQLALFMAAARLLGDAIVQGIEAGLRALVGVLTRLAKDVTTALARLSVSAFTAATTVGFAIAQGIWAGLKGMAGWLKDRAESMLRDILGSLNPFSPVEHGGELYIGRPLAEGAIRGWILGSAVLPGLMSETLRRAAASVKIGASIAAVAPGRSVASAGGLVSGLGADPFQVAANFATPSAAPSSSQTVVINVQGSLVHERDLAETVRKALSQTTRGNANIFAGQA